MSDRQEFVHELLTFGRLHVNISVERHRFLRLVPSHLELKLNKFKPCISRIFQGISPSSTTSPANTLAMPDIAITTFWETEQPVIVCISLLTAAFGNADRRYISYRSSCSSVKLETSTLKIHPLEFERN